MISRFSADEQRSWLRLLAPNDAANHLQRLSPEERSRLLILLYEPTRREVAALLVYVHDVAGGLMSPHFVTPPQGL